MTDTIRVKITRETYVNGDRYALGDVVDLDAHDARTLMAMHKAERCNLTDEQIEAANAEAAAKAEQEQADQAKAEAARRAAEADAEAARRAAAAKKPAAQANPDPKADE